MNTTSPALRAPLTRIAERRIWENIHTIEAVGDGMLAEVLETLWNERTHMLQRIAELECRMAERHQEILDLTDRITALEGPDDDDFMEGEDPLPPLCFACRGETEGGVLCPGCTAYVVGGPVLVA